MVGIQLVFINNLKSYTLNIMILHYQSNKYEVVYSDTSVCTNRF